MALADYRTFFTFSQPLSVPGVTLPAGKYLFRVPGESSTRDVVQIAERRRQEGARTVLRASPPAQRHALPI